MNSNVAVIQVGDTRLEILQAKLERTPCTSFWTGVRKLIKEENKNAKQKARK